MARRTANGNLGSISRVALEAELRRRQRRVQTLQRRHAKLVSSANKIEAQIRELGGGASAVSTARLGRPPGGAKRGAKPGVKRPRNEQNLVEALRSLLKGKTMNVTTIASEVQKAGYKTTSPNFRTIVNQTLLKSDKFKKVARGQYTSR